MKGMIRIYCWLPALLMLLASCRAGTGVPQDIRSEEERYVDSLAAYFSQYSASGYNDSVILKAGPMMREAASEGDTLKMLCACVFDDFSKVEWKEISLSSWLALAYLIVFGSLLAYSAYVWLLKVRPATEVATHAYVNPVVAVVIGGGLGGEDVTRIQLLGLAVILVSVMLVNRQKRTKRNETYDRTGGAGTPV